MKKLILALLVLGLFVAACEEGQEGDGVAVPFIGGTDALLISFEADAPPAEVYDGGDFPFDIELKILNAGEREVKKEDIKIQISGIDPVEFDKQSADFFLSPAENIEAKAKDPAGNIIEPNPVYLTIPDLNHVQSVTGNLNYPILATACYKYGTEALSRLCIKQNLYETGGACAVAGEKPVVNSGAPIQVSSLTESVAGASKIAFVFKIEHKGEGKIFKLGTECNKANVRGDENKVNVEVETGLAGLKCTQLRDGTETKGYVTLVDGEATVRCEQEITTPGEFLKTVNIKIDYDYQQTVSTSILVIHAD